jgi:hypothetical protein
MTVHSSFVDRSLVIRFLKAYDLLHTIAQLEVIVLLCQILPFLILTVIASISR